MRTIVQNGDPVLRHAAKPLPEELFGTPELAQLLHDMSDALDREHDGVALAAPQIGVGLRLFIVRMDRVDESSSGAPEGEAAPHKEPRPLVGVFANPEIIRTSRKRQRADEGCLSVRGVYGTTNRHERVTIHARQPDGSTFTRGAGGLLAQIFEHEVDHLNGILFIDTAENLVEIPPPADLTEEHEREPA